MAKKLDRPPLKTAPPLEPFLIDDCIEQFNRGVWPNYAGVELDVFLSIMKNWLIELRALRDNQHNLNAKINWLKREVNDAKFELEEHKYQYN